MSSHRVPPLKKRTQSTMFERHNCNTLLKPFTVINLQIFCSFPSLSPLYSTVITSPSNHQSSLSDLSSQLLSRHRVFKGLKFCSLSPPSVLDHVSPSTHNRFSPSFLNHHSLNSPFPFCSRFHLLLHLPSPSLSSALATVTEAHHTVLGFCSSSWLVFRLWAFYSVFLVGSRLGEEV